LRAAGLATATKQTYAADRTAPFRPTVRAFLDRHLRALWEMVRDHLAGDARTALEGLMYPCSDRYLPSQPSTELTCLFTVWTAMRSSEVPPSNG
jgi:hypothetical protein